jgi:restriction endonuclease S subunit
MFREIKMPLPPLEFQTAILARLAALESQLTALETLQRQSEDNARFILESYLYTAPSVPLGSAGIDVITHE